MEELLGKEIGVDLSSKEAMAELVKIDTGLEDIRKKSKDIRISFDTKEARAQLALLRADAGKSGDVGGGGIISKIGGLFGGGGAAAPAAGQGAPAAASAGAGLMNPYTITAGVVAAVASLPFIAQAAAGSLVFALGGALSAMGIAGAIMSGKLTGQFNKLKTSATNDLKDIGKAFIPVLSSIMSTASSVLKTLTPVFSAVMRTIAGPFKLFADTIVKGFAQPAVIQSIKDVSKAFGAILTAFTPDIPGIFNSFAQAISRIADAVAKNPKAFADFLNFIFQIVIALVECDSGD